MAFTFANLESEVYLQCGITSSQQTEVDRWLTIAQNDLCSRWPWPFMLGRETVVTVPDKTDGTVAVSAGGTTVTGSSTAFASTDVGSFIQFEGSNDWYIVSAYSSATSITIGTAYAESDALSGATYTLRKFFYSLSSSADRIIDVRNWDTPVKLYQMDARTLDGMVPLMPATGGSYGYVAYGVDSSGNLRITPYPFPSDARLFEIRTVTRPSDNAISIPNKYAHVMAFGAIALGFAYLRKLDFAKAWSDRFEAGIIQMKKECRTTEDYQPTLTPIDGVSGRNAFQPLPSGYPVV